METPTEIINLDGLEYKIGLRGKVFFHGTNDEWYPSSKPLYVIEKAIDARKKKRLETEAQKYKKNDSRKLIDESGRFSAKDNSYKYVLAALADAREPQTVNEIKDITECAKSMIYKVISDLSCDVVRNYGLKQCSVSGHRATAYGLI